MFLDKLSKEQHQAIFDLAANLAAADNDISEEEILYLKDFSAAYGIDFDLNKADIDVGETLSRLNTKEVRIIALQQLIKISYKDGHFGREDADFSWEYLDKVEILKQALEGNNEVQKNNISVAEGNIVEDRKMHY